MQSLVLVPMLLAVVAWADDSPVTAQQLQYTQSEKIEPGEYGFPYADDPSSKTEFRSLDGTTAGTYNYVDSNGELQTVGYIADEDGFRATGTNVLDSRKRRAVLLYPFRSFATAFPAATSSQSRFQIHNDAKFVQEFHTPLYPVLHSAPSPIFHHPALLLRKKRSSPSPEAAAEEPQRVVEKRALPLSVSSQSRLQLHHNAKIVERIHSGPIAVAGPLPAAVVAPLLEPLPLSTSSQSRYQIHSGAKIIQQQQEEVLAPVVVVEAEDKAAGTVRIIDAKATDAVPLALAPIAALHESLPLSTSSQSRYQLHDNGLGLGGGGGKVVIEESHGPLLYPTLHPYLYRPYPILAPAAIYTDAVPYAPAADAAFLTPIYAGGGGPALAAVEAPAPIFPLEDRPAQQPSQSHQKQESAETTNGNGDSITVDSA